MDNKKLTNSAVHPVNSMNPKRKKYQLQSKEKLENRQMIEDISMACN